MTEVLSHSGTTLLAHEAHASGPNNTKVHDTTSVVHNGLTLQGTGGAIQGVGLLEPCDPDTPIEKLSERLSRDGAVWVCNKNDNLALVQPLIQEVSPIADLHINRSKAYSTQRWSRNSAGTIFPWSIRGRTC